MRKIGVIGVLIVLLFCLAVEIPALAVETPAETYKSAYTSFSVSNNSSSEIWGIKRSYRIAPDFMVRGGFGKFFARETEVISLMVGGVYILYPYRSGDGMLLPYLVGEMGCLVSPEATHSVVQFIVGVELIRADEELPSLSVAVELKYLISSMEIAEKRYLGGLFCGLFWNIKI